MREKLYNVPIYLTRSKPTLGGSFPFEEETTLEVKAKSANDALKNLRGRKDYHTNYELLPIHEQEKLQPFMLRVNERIREI